MLATTCLMFLIITTVWNKSLLMALLVIIIFGSLEFLYFTASLLKFPHGGWLPFLFSLTTLTTMSSWHYGTSKKLAFKLQNKVSFDHLLSSGPTLGLVRVPGIAVVYTNTVMGVPAMFAHFVTNFPASHRILIFVSLQTYLVPTVSTHDRFLFGRAGDKENQMFWCVVRTGYKECGTDSYDFEDKLLEKLAEFLKNEHSDKRRVMFEGECEELRELEERESGLAYMMGSTTVVATEASPWVKKVVIDGVYGFLWRNSRQPPVVRRVPPASLIEVGMVYHV